ncbi:MAG: TIR domain-containing protein [Clostridiales bacterium]|nr:TIR domain-containing protein [Clostridiales bacterium]
MTIIKCKMCGGDIQRSEGQAYGTCDSCGSTMTFPKVSDEQRANLFNRANHFRRQGEFDKAIAAYESILNQDDGDAEAHWGVVLSRYGIEYVEDPASHERVPTCHRVQVDSILNDADYLAALEHAPDGYSRSLYEEEARRIAELQKGILMLSAQEKPYDVFICYKETTDGGSRTPDSALAQEVYYQLVQEGYKVFFSRITLEDKLGQQYEPYIFAALNSARVMVVIGTQAEYFNAVWVKNEWSRFLALMKKDRTKLLIPCYKGMDAYDLPEALSMLQSQDMGKIGFIQDLVRGIKKVVDASRGKPGATTVPMQAETIAAPGVQSLLTRAGLFLEDGDFKSAAEYADKVLDIDPKHAPAYIVRLQASLNLRDENELGNAKESLEMHGDYQKAVRFADSKLKPIYIDYNQRILDRLETERKESIYQTAINQNRDAVSEAGYLQAAKTFQSISGYKDADERALESQATAEQRRLLKLKQEEEQQAEQDRLEAERAARAEQERIAEEKRRVKNKRRILIGTPILVAAIAIILLITQVIMPKTAYQKATDLLSAKQYDQAAEAFTALGDYSDSAEKAQASIYQKATDLLSAKQYDQAAEAFTALGDYSDSAAMVTESFYQKGKALLTKGQYADVARLFIHIKDFKDVASLIASDPGLSSAAAAAELDRAWSVGNVVTFGNYEQDNNTSNGKEAIQWIVLKRDGDKALIISKQNLDSQPYHSIYGFVTWETSSLRVWLNDRFLNTAFSEEEQGAILTTNLQNEANPQYNTKGGNPTEDKVFLLSIAEAESLFGSDADRVAKNTDYAKAQGAYTDKDNGAGRWWLRSPGSNQRFAALVKSVGSVYRSGGDAFYVSDAFRPALWLNLSSEFFSSKAP